MGREGPSFISPELQAHQIEAWAKSRGIRVEMLGAELDQSGSKMHRPIFDAALKRVEDGEVAGIVVAKLNRFARTLVGALDALRRIDEAGGEFVAVAEGFDPTTPTGKAFMRIALVFAELELDRIRESWDEAHREAIARGVHHGGRGIPFGYTREEGEPLEVVADLIPVVRGIFERRAAGVSAWAITDWLDETHPKERAWGEAQVERIWRSRVYLGEARHGEHVNTEAHTAIVPPTLYEAANRVTGGTGRTSRDDLLAGLLRCGGCRYAMQISTQKQRNGTTAIVARCRKKHGGGDCTEPATVTLKNLEPYVVAQVLTFAGSSAWADEPGTEKLQTLEGSIELAETRRAEFLADDDLRELTSREAYLAEAGRREFEIAALQVALVDERAVVGSADVRRHFLITDWIGWDTAKRSEVLREIIDSIYVRRGRGSVADRFLIVQDDTFERPKRGSLDYATTPIPWPEAPDVDPDYEPPISKEAKSSSVPVEDLRLALADYPEDVVDVLLGAPS
jgi:site-specific DNA recombinase